MPLRNKAKVGTGRQRTETNMNHKTRACFSHKLRKCRPKRMCSTVKHFGTIKFKKTQNLFIECKFLFLIGPIKI